MGFRKLTPFIFNQPRRNKKTDKSRTAASRLYILELSVSFEGLYYCILRILHNSILSDVVYNVRSGRIKSVM